MPGSILPPGVDMIQWCLSRTHMEEAIASERQRARDGMGRTAILHAHSRNEGSCNERCKTLVHGQEPETA